MVILCFVKIYSKARIGCELFKIAFYQPYAPNQWNMFHQMKRETPQERGCQDPWKRFPNLHISFMLST